MAAIRNIGSGGHRAAAAPRPPVAPRLMLAVAALAPAPPALASPAEPRIAIEKVIHAGEPAPGIPGCTLVLPLQPQIDALCNVLVFGFIDGPGVTAESDTAIWLGPPGALQLIIREGDPAPGYAPGVIVRSLLGADERLSETGWISFSARLRGPGITAGWNDRAVFAGPPGDIQRTWTGATDLSWGEASNWSPPGVPSAEDDVLHATADVIEVDLGTQVVGTQIRSLTVDGTMGGGLLILAGRGLQINGNFTNTATGAANLYEVTLQPNSLLRIEGPGSCNCCWSICRSSRQTT